MKPDVHRMPALRRAATRRRAAPLLALLPLLGSAATLAGCGRAPASRPPSVLVVTLDTTRADALGCYGGQRGVSPSLDALAAESLVYERAFSVAPITLPAHASLFTGLYPLRHSVRDNGLWPLPSEARTLAELAREAGYQTAAVLASAVLDRTFGLDQGFETYLGSGVAQEHAVYASLPAREVVERALGWLRTADPERPFLLWTHFYDPHAPYDPPAAFRAGLQGFDLYFGEIASMDHELGRLLAALRERGELEHTVVVVVADHGEALGEHGEYTHGPYCYQPTLRVPLLVRYPDGYRAGERDASAVSLVDLFPTLAEGMGLTSGAVGDVDGASLWKRTAPAERGLYFESYMGYLAFGWSQLSGWVEGSHKVLCSSEPQAFDLATDPGELHDLLPAGAFDPEPARRAIAALAARPVLAAAPLERLDDALRDALLALGYAAPAAAGASAAGLPHPLAESERPSPQRMIGQYGFLLRAVSLLESGQDEQAIAILERAVEVTPENSFALEHLSSALLRQGRAREALPWLERLTAQGPPRSLAFQNLASAYSALGRLDESIEALQHAIALDPDNRAALLGLVRLLTRMGRADEATAYRARLDRLDVR